MALWPVVGPGWRGCRYGTGSGDAASPWLDLTVVSNCSVCCGATQDYLRNSTNTTRHKAEVACSTTGCVEMCIELARGFNQTGFALMLEIMPAHETISQHGFEFANTARQAIREATDDDITAGYLAGMAVTGLELIERVYDSFPMIIGYISGVVLVLMIVSFRSVVIAVKAVISIALTLSITYGSAALVWQWGYLEWTGYRGFSQTGALCWVPPILCICMLVGLGLDYHVFLLSRVVEYRR